MFPDVVIIIVGFRNLSDVVRCLRSLSNLSTHITFDIFILENGGPEAYDEIISALNKDKAFRSLPVDARLPTHHCDFKRRIQFELVGGSGAERPRVSIAEAPCNLGYAGGVNAWLAPLLQSTSFKGAWILNPDTAPEPDALDEMVAYAARRGKGMVGSRLTLIADPERMQTRGLAWRKLKASTLAVDRGELASVEPDADAIERRLDSPSGASIYVTRELLDQIGLMDERYFLYFEDLEWGIRAKKLGAVGYAHRAIVPHAGGTTIGTARRRIDRSPLAVYLEYRNRILFVRAHFPLWVPWTIFIGLVQIAIFAGIGAFANVAAAIRGLMAGISGETGKPKFY